MNAISAVATFYKEGGMYMHAVLVIAVVITAIVIERLIIIGRATALNGRKFTDDLVRYASRGDLMGARNVSTQSNAPVARVAQAMLHTAGHDEAALQSAADDASILVLPDLSKRLPTLNVLANSATLIGLLGTITGLITARDQRRFMDFQNHRYLKTSRQLGESTVYPQWIQLNPPSANEARKEPSR